MSNKCLSAFTEMTPSEPGVYVGFTNLYEMEDGRIRLSIRERGTHNAPYATVYMSKDETIKYLSNALTYLTIGL